MRQQEENDNNKHPCTFPECNKSFTLRGNMIRHLKSHSDERKFICQLCHNKFLRNCHLKQHLQSNKHKDQRIKANQLLNQLTSNHNSSTSTPKMLSPKLKSVNLNLSRSLSLTHSF